MLEEANTEVSVLLGFGATSSTFRNHYAVSKCRVPVTRWRDVMSENDGDGKCTAAKA